MSNQNFHSNFFLYPIVCELYLICNQLVIALNACNIAQTMITCIFYAILLIAISTSMEIDDDTSFWCRDGCHRWDEYFPDKAPLGSVWTHTRANVTEYGAPTAFCKRLKTFPNIVNHILDEKYWLDLGNFTNVHAVIKNDTKFRKVTPDIGGILELKAWQVLYWRAAERNIRLDQIHNQKHGIPGASALLSQSRFWDIDRHIKWSNEQLLNLSNPNRHFDTLTERTADRSVKLWSLGDVSCTDEGRLKCKSKKHPYLDFQYGKPDKIAQTNWKVCQQGYFTHGFCTKNILYVDEKTYVDPTKAKRVDLDLQLFDLRRNKVNVADNYFTNLAILDEITPKRVGLVGTFSLPFKCCPKYFGSKEWKKEIKDMDRGTIRQFKCGKYTATLWKDSSDDKVAKFIDNCCDRDQWGYIYRRVNSKLTRFHVPSVVIKYNNHKSEVDCNNQQVKAGNTEKKTRRINSLRPAMHLINTYALVNGAILAHECDPDCKLDGKAMRNQLYDQWTAQRLEWLKENNQSKQTRKTGANPNDIVKPEGTHLRRKIDPKNKQKQRTCIVCKKKTTFACDSCYHPAYPSDIVPYCKPCFAAESAHD